MKEGFVVAFLWLVSINGLEITRTADDNSARADSHSGSSRGGDEGIRFQSIQRGGQYVVRDDRRLLVKM
jgi:hypothetical protein